jgi:caa(3)-type oxidase subunit IV
MTHEPTHKGGGGRYVGALLALLVLTGLSFALSYAPLGAAGPPIALSIAGIKVLIVGAVFMHLREAVFATRFVGVVTVLFIALLCLGVVADVGFR